MLVQKLPITTVQWWSLYNVGVSLLSSDDDVSWRKTSVFCDPIKKWNVTTALTRKQPAQNQHFEVFCLLHLLWWKIVIHSIQKYWRCLIYLTWVNEYILKVMLCWRINKEGKKSHLFLCVEWWETFPVRYPSLTPETNLVFSNQLDLQTTLVKAGLDIWHRTEA